jgi:hypothetical protein
MAVDAITLRSSIGPPAITSRSSTAMRPEQREVREASMPSPHAPPWARSPSPRARAAARQTWGGGGRGRCLEHRDATGAWGGRGQHLRREEISRMSNI